MAKASRPGNQAVAGITSQMTPQEQFPTYYASNNAGTGTIGTSKKHFLRLNQSEHVNQDEHEHFQ